MLAAWHGARPRQKRIAAAVIEPWIVQTQNLIAFDGNNSAVLVELLSTRQGFGNRTALLDCLPTAHVPRSLVPVTAIDWIHGVCDSRLPISSSLAIHPVRTLR
jgi:hypothetical protein